MSQRYRVQFLVEAEGAGPKDAATVAFQKLQEASHWCPRVALIQDGVPIFGTEKQVTVKAKSQETKT